MGKKKKKESELKIFGDGLRYLFGEVESPEDKNQDERKKKKEKVLELKT